MSQVSVDHLVSEIENIEKKLEAIKLELLKLKALQTEAEEIDDRELEKMLKEAEELYRSGKGLSVEEFRKEAGLD